MKYTFVKIKHEFGDWGWWLKIKDWLQLYDWYMEVQSKSVGCAVLDFLSSKEFHYLVSDKSHRKNHFTTKYGILLLKESERQFALGNKVGLHSLVGFLSDMLMKDKIEQLNKGVILYINKVGGYSAGCKKWEEVDFLLKDDFVFPDYAEKDIKVFQWNMGIHWYGKIGDVDVVVDGEQKWKTYEQAKNNATQFLKGL